jgi:small subunit ribosomal protein S6
MSATRVYELVYIIQPEASEQEVADLHGLVQTIVQKFSGTIEKSENWGRKRLAYEIGRYKEGIYVLELIQGPGDMIKEIDRRLKVADAVVRHLVVRVDEEVRVADRRQAERREERARRRAARGLPPEPEQPESPAIDPSTGDEQDLQPSEV